MLYEVITNVLVDEPDPNEYYYVEALSRLNAFVVMLNFHFE